VQHAFTDHQAVSLIKHCRDPGLHEHFSSCTMKPGKKHGEVRGMLENTSGNAAGQSERGRRAGGTG